MVQIFETHRLVESGFELSAALEDVIADNYPALYLVAFRLSQYSESIGNNFRTMEGQSKAYQQSLVSQTDKKIKVPDSLLQDAFNVLRDLQPELNLARKDRYYAEKEEVIALKKTTRAVRETCKAIYATQLTSQAIVQNGHPR